MSGKKIYTIEEKKLYNQEKIIEEMDKAIKEHYDCILLYAEKTSPIDKLIKKVKTTSIPIRKLQTIVKK